MKNKLILITITISVLALLLSSCSGAGATATSWGGATVTDSAVYFANGTQVFALRLDNGASIWANPYPTKAAANRQFLAAPILAGDQLIIADTNHTLTSLNSRNGTAENWVFSEAKGKYIDSPLVVGETVVAPNADHSLYAVDLQAGSMIWKFSTDGAFWVQPVTDGTTVFAPNMDHFLYAVDLSKGTQLWKTDLNASLIARPLLVDGVIYLGSLDGNFYAIDSKNGDILWGPIKLAGGIWSAPVYVDGKIFFGDQSGDINVLNAADGKTINTIQTKSAILGSGVVIKDGIVFGKENGEIQLVGLDGSEGWKNTIGKSLYSNISSNGSIYAVVITKGDYELITFDTDGKQSWPFTSSAKK